MPKKIIKYEVEQVLERAYGARGEWGNLSRSVFYNGKNQEKVIFSNGEFQQYAPMRFNPVLEKIWDLDDERKIIYRDFQFTLTDGKGCSVWEYDLPHGSYPSEDYLLSDGHLYFTIQHEINDCIGKLVRLPLDSNNWTYLNLNNLYCRSRLILKDDQIVYVGGLFTDYKNQTIEFHYTTISKELGLLDAKLLSVVNFERNNIYLPDSKFRYVFYMLYFQIPNVHLIRFDQETGELKDLEMPAKFQFPACRDHLGNIWGYAMHGNTSDLFLINVDGELLHKIRIKGVVQNMSSDHNKKEIWAATSYEPPKSPYPSAFHTLIYKMSYQE